MCNDSCNSQHACNTNSNTPLAARRQLAGSYRTEEFWSGCRVSSTVRGRLSWRAHFHPIGPYIRYKSYTLLYFSRRYGTVHM